MQNEKWETSEVQCDICNHTWVAVRPFKTPKLECPNCSIIGNFENVEEFCED